MNNKINRNTAATEIEREDINKRGKLHCAEKNFINYLQS